MEENTTESSLSLRDALEAAVEQHTQEPSSSEQTGRARDESGRFVKTEAEQQAVATQEVVEQQVQEEQKRAPRPSSWKKDYDEQWNTLDPRLQEYINQRETEFKTGVSTYKQEAERARTLMQAIEPFTPDLQRHGIQPDQWIQNLGRAHQMLALGSPSQKAQMFTRLARDYGIDISQLTGQPMQEPQMNGDQTWMAEQLSQLRGELNSFRSMQVQQHQQAVQSEIEKFRADPSHEHFDQVAETMAGLLQSGIAKDLDSAYAKAIRMHDDIWEAQQASQRQQEEAEQKRLAAEAAKQARAKVASVKTATPSGQATATQATGRRAQLAEAFASASSGRV